MRKQRQELERETRALIDFLNKHPTITWTVLIVIGIASFTEYVIRPVWINAILFLWWVSLALFTVVETWRKRN